MLADIFIILFTASTVYRSWGSGFVRQFLGTAGFFGGLLLGRWLEPHVIGLSHSVAGRTALTIATVLGLALLLLALGEYVGVRFKLRLLHGRFNRLDNALGSVLTTFSVLISFWLLAAVAGNLPNTGLTNTIRSSHIVAGLNRLLPSAPGVISDLGRLIDPNGFPNVFLGAEPIPRSSVNLPALGQLSSAVSGDQASVVRIEGQGCGGIVTGSGFVIGPGLVATNAHVVAGIARPFVQDSSGNHRGRVVWFDPELDFAVLRVSDLAGRPLTLDTSPASVGTPGAVLGYPGGGNFTAAPAAVLDEFQASGQDIYDHGHTVRDIYELKASVIPGNSGGPAVGQDGRVLGVVFAESTSYHNVGYALTAHAVAGEISQAAQRQQTVSTGSCAE